jgi:hypothetical protein
MFVESWKSGTGRFWPSYRYEPFTDIYFSRQPILAYRQSYKDHPFWVDANGMDPNDVPSNHQNVMPIYYPVSPMTIGNYLADNLDQYTVGTGKKRSLVGLKEVNDNSTWYAYTSMLRILVRYYMDQLDYSQQVAQDSADEWMETYFKDIYGGIWAQTRKAASYGFSQMLYTTALGRHYPRSYTSLPEILNQQDTLLPLVNRFLVEKATIILDGVSFDQSQWNSGLEAVWLRTFKMYNRGKASYAPEVIQRTALFPPLE